jgi:hypothetical protein
MVNNVVWDTVHHIPTTNDREGYDIKTTVPPPPNNYKYTSGNCHVGKREEKQNADKKGKRPTCFGNKDNCKKAIFTTVQTV